MYYIDTPTERVDVYAYDGELGTRATFAEVDGYPDGLTVDDEGFVWIAFYGGSRVERRAPDGSLDRVVPVPTENVTSCCFGGTTLYITTGRGDGRVYAYDAGVSGPQAIAVPENGAFGRRADERAVAAEHAGRVRQRRRSPRGEPLGELRVVDLEVERPRVDVDRDRVAVAHDGERAAARRLGRDVADHQPARRAGEAPVGDERDALAEPGADDRRR